jgi:hypothetical protein
MSRPGMPSVQRKAKEEPQTSPLFTPDKIPTEITTAIKMLAEKATAGSEMGDIVKKIIQDIVLNSNDDSDDRDESFIALQKSLSCQDMKSDFGLIYTGIYSILKRTIRSKQPVTQFNSDMTILGLPTEIVESMTRVLIRSRPLLESSICYTKCKFPSLQKLRWRVDVVISSGSLSRVMRPIMMFQIILSNGKVTNFEVTIEQFNQLRYGVAKLLYDMQALERHPIMKIVKEFSLRETEAINK